MIQQVKGFDCSPLAADKRDEDPLVNIFEEAKECKDVSCKVRDKVSLTYSVSSVDKVEGAAVSLVGRKYIFREGKEAYFKDCQVTIMIARSEQFRKCIENDQLHFPFLSKETFSFMVADFDVRCNKHIPPSFKMRVEVYKTFGSSLNWEYLLDYFHSYSPINFEEALFCYQLLKDDPKVMNRLQLRLRFEPNIMLELRKHIPDLDWPIVLNGHKEGFEELAKASQEEKFIELDMGNAEQLKLIKDKREVEFRNASFWQERTSFKENNPELAKLTVVSISGIKTLLARSITHLDISHCILDDEDWKEIGKLNLSHFSLSYLSRESPILKRYLTEIVSKLDSLELSGDHYDILQCGYSKLKRLTLNGFTQAFYMVEQPSVTFFGWHTYSNMDHLLNRYLSYLPNLEVLDISLGSEVLNSVSINTFTALKDTKIKILILKGRYWPHIPFKSKVANKIEEIDVTLGCFFEGKIFNRMENLLETCPELKRIVYSGHERYNFLIQIEALKAKFTQVEFIER